MSTPLRIGIPSVHSRLHPKVMRVLGLSTCQDPRRLTFYDDQAAVFLLRGWDLAPMLATARLDIVFCGRDSILEQGLENQVQIVHHFTSDRSPISLCRRRGVRLNPRDLTVATEYPRMTRGYLGRCFGNLSTVFVRGSTETFAHLKGIHAIVDIVETGSTLAANNLVRVADLFDTYPCMATRKREDFTSDVTSVQELSSLIYSALSSNQKGS